MLIVMILTVHGNIFLMVEMVLMLKVMVMVRQFLTVRVIVTSWEVYVLIKNARKARKARKCRFNL